MAGAATEKPRYTKKDFQSAQDVRWCPGCGDYAILSAVQGLLPNLGIPREKFVFVSGIGCSSRFPYYVETYGLHTIHGRAPAIATGVKIANPSLSTWVVTGDGDGLSIGGNHLLHACRRNVDLNILLFNNQIYGLTKGQYSPTSPQGQRTKSTPDGSIDYPINPIRFALAAEATFIGRSVDVDIKHLTSVVEQAARHKGASFVEIFQNCIVFNDGAFKSATDKTVREEHVLYLEHGKPMRFGKERKKGIRLDGFQPRVVTVGEGGVGESDLLVHDERDIVLAGMLARMHPPEFPFPVGVIRRIERPTYEDLLHGQIEEARKRAGGADLASLFRSGEVWTVEAS